MVEDCKHENTTIIRVIYPSSECVAEYCIVCVKRMRAIRKSLLWEEGIDYASLEKVNINDLNEAKYSYDRKVTEQYRAAYKERKEKWFQAYNEYLASERWREKRRAVIERESNLCQGCKKRGIENVHHLTYDNVGDELLYQLVGLCYPCHEKVHQKTELNTNREIDDELEHDEEMWADEEEVFEFDGDPFE